MSQLGKWNRVNFHMTTALQTKLQRTCDIGSPYCSLGVGDGGGGGVGTAGNGGIRISHNNITADCTTIN